MPLKICSVGDKTDWREAYRFASYSMGFSTTWLFVPRTVASKEVSNTSWESFKEWLEVSIISSTFDILPIELVANV